MHTFHDVLTAANSTIEALCDGPIQDGKPGFTLSPEGRSTRTQLLSYASTLARSRLLPKGPELDRLCELIDKGRTQANPALGLGPAFAKPTPTPMAQPPKPVQDPHDPTHPSKVAPAAPRAPSHLDDLKPASQPGTHTHPKPHGHGRGPAGHK
jgi:hypothetical protein